MRPLSAAEALDRYFLEARSKLLDLAAILDRVHRGGGAADELRLRQIREALQVLLSDEPAKAERIQMIFSLPYDPDWQIPRPRT
jgi:hypothetical protein